MARGVKKKLKAPENPEKAIYFYGVTRAGIAQRMSAEGVDGTAAVEAFPCVGLVGWISRVNRAEFADRLSQNMENLEWLAGASVRHQRVVGAIAAHTSILPARFGTVFLTESSLALHLRRRRLSLLAVFKRTADADEWGVKVFETAPAVRAVPASSGTEYLRRKAAANAPRRGLDPEVRSLAQALRRVAVDAAAGGKVSSGQRGLVWQGSFLLRRARQRQWRAVLAHFAARWRSRRRIECTGPWPPYSFVSADGR